MKGSFNMHSIDSIRVIDSDTVEGWVRVADEVQLLWRIRIKGIEGGEAGTVEGARGKLALEALVKAAAPKGLHFFGLPTVKDKYGRHVGDIVDGEGRYFSIVLMKGGSHWVRKRTGEERGGPYSGGPEG